MTITWWEFRPKITCNSLYFAKEAHTVDIVASQKDHFIHFIKRIKGFCSYYALLSKGKRNRFGALWRRHINAQWATWILQCVSLLNRNLMKYLFCVRRAYLHQHTSVQVQLFFMPFNKVGRFISNGPFKFLPKMLKIRSFFYVLPALRFGGKNPNESR